VSLAEQEEEDEDNESDEEDGEDVVNGVVARQRRKDKEEADKQNENDEADEDDFESLFERAREDVAMVTQMLQESRKSGGIDMVMQVGSMGSGRQVGQRNCRKSLVGRQREAQVLGLCSKGRGISCGKLWHLAQVVADCRTGFLYHWFIRSSA
jgi:hypothetical protein